MDSQITKVDRKLLQNGVAISVNRRDFQITYPLSIWKEFPEVYRQNFADSIAYAMTAYLCMDGHDRLSFNFPQPSIEPYIFESMVYSFGETSLVSEGKENIPDLLKKFYNKNITNEFRGRPRYSRFQKIVRNNKNRAIIPFSFGKDSLLTYALCQELGIEPFPIFFREPKSPFENRHKRKLSEKFYKEFGSDVLFFPVSPGRLRENEGSYWGWDMLFTQYSLLLIPYFFGLRSKYLFWSHEQDCNDYFKNKDGFLVNPVFEQSNRWVLTLNHIARGLGSNTLIASIIEPISELSTTYVLHHRYPKIAKYQFSCFAEVAKRANRRWCGMCEKCATIYLFLHALKIDPKNVGFSESMFSDSKRSLYVLFDNSNRKDRWRDQQLFAFYLAYKNNSKGPLIKEFEKKFLVESKRREKQFRQQFFGIHSFDTVTYDLKNPLLKIYQEELAPLNKT